MHLCDESVRFCFYTDVLSSEIIPRILRHVRTLLSSTMDSLGSDVLESDPGSQFWLNMIQAIKDSYAVERMSEQLLHQLATEQVGDVEAYWILWLLFHRVFKYQISVRLVNHLSLSVITHTHNFATDIELAFAAWFVVYLTKFSDILQNLA